MTPRGCSPVPGSPTPIQSHREVVFEQLGGALGLVIKQVQSALPRGVVPNQSKKLSQSLTQTKHYQSMDLVRDRGNRTHRPPPKFLRMVLAAQHAPISHPATECFLAPERSRD
jgi:hypothetical protein